MPRSLRGAVLLLALVLLLVPASAPGAPPLRILLTNDDGVESPGIRALHAALEKAGHDVVVVAPRRNQSGKGSSLRTDVGSFVDLRELAPGVWAVESTPADAVRAALGAVLADGPPDLVISGLNFGANLGRPGSLASGTVGAALQALHAGIPAIAASVGLDVSEAQASPVRFPSTGAAFEPAAGFVVRLVDRLVRGPGPGPAGLLPEGILLNVNFPVPYEAIEGVEVTRLAPQADLAIVWRDVRGAVAQGGGPVRIDLAMPGPQPPGTDTHAHHARRISITPLDGDMTARPALPLLLGVRLGGLEP